ncbi:MAG TPA: hypothetical protein VMG12_42035 [Polyangiaceae bacterium]|nr:hypothetical protein [Polyangiaceae bacterium]
MKTNTSVRSSLALLVALGAYGCASDVVSIGEERTSQLLERGSRCARSVDVEGDVRIRSQAELDELSGCEQIGGDLSIEIFEGTDLSPLSALRVVGGSLEIGLPPPFSSEGVETLEELDELDAEYDAILARMRAIADAGWLESLHGVEALEQVGTLRLVDISAPDLRAFVSLRNVAAHYRSANAGIVGMLRMRNLVDLSGLENITGVRSLAMQQNPVLESLDGITLGAGLDEVSLGGNPRLYDLDALIPLERVQKNFILSGSAARDLDALANLGYAYGGVEIESNPELVDATGLNGLVAADELNIERNTALRRVPEFQALSSIRRIAFEDNPQLETVTIDALFLTVPLDRVRNRELPNSADWLVFAANAGLRSISLPHAFPSARIVAIQDNASLVSVDLGNLEQIGELLSIQGNAQLSDVRLGDLRSAAALEVIDNPQLSTATLGAVPSFDSTFTGNADTPEL